MAIANISFGYLTPPKPNPNPNHEIQMAMVATKRTSFRCCLTPIKPRSQEMIEKVSKAWCKKHGKRYVSPEVIERLRTSPNPVQEVSAENMERIFDSWCKQYGKTYDSEKERLDSFKAFKENYYRSMRDSTNTLTIDEFSDRINFAFRGRGLGPRSVQATRELQARMVEQASRLGAERFEESEEETLKRLFGEDFLSYME